MKKTDIALIAFYILLTAVIAVLTLMPGANASGGYVDIQIGGKSLEHITLPKGSSFIDRRIDIGSGKYNVVRLTKDGAVIADASCKDKICVHHAKITRAGEVIVCLPNKFVVELHSSDETGQKNVDIISN